MGAKPKSPRTFSDFVESNPHMLPELPLVHSTRVEFLRSLGIAGNLVPRNCPVFKEPLVYLFYGRPAYRSTRGGYPDTSIQCCPVCLIFKTNFLSVRPVRIYPFDTGAAKGGKFKPYIAPKSTDKYSLQPVIDTVRRFTHMFFESNGDYFLGRPKGVLSIPLTEASAANYYSFVSHGGIANYDDRRSAVEIQYCDPIPLRGMLWAVALPTSFLEHPDIRNTVITEWGAFPLTYNVVRGTPPNEYSSVIRDLYERWLRVGGLM